MSFNDDSSYDHLVDGRYPDGVRGGEQWARYVWDDLDGLEPEDAPALPEFLKEGETLPPPPRPRLFISHRSHPRDVAYAMRIRALAQHVGFTTWLDVLDPNLIALNSGRRALTPVQQAVAVALIVEIALLNCTHVIAVMTPRTRASRWVPYEYGRVKDQAVLASQAACWIEPRTFGPNSFPEYLRLGPTFATTQAQGSEAALSAWLIREASLPPWNPQAIGGVPGVPPAALP